MTKTKEYIWHKTKTKLQNSWGNTSWLTDVLTMCFLRAERQQTFLLIKTELIVWIEGCAALAFCCSVLWSWSGTFSCTYINAVVIIPNSDPRDVEVWRSFHIPDDKIQLDRRVEWTRPHVALFCGLNAHRTDIEYMLISCINCY